MTTTVTTTGTHFAYTSRKQSGKVVHGRMEAPNEAAVVSRLRTMGMSPVTIEQTAASSGLSMDIKIPGFERRVPLKDIAVMSRQLSTMIGAGLSLLRALTILTDQTENKRLASVLDEVRTDVERGSSLSEAVAKHDRVFPPMMIHLIRAGELGGFLDKSLESVAGTFEADVKLRATIKSALTYPVIVLCMAVIATIAMLVFIVPVFQNMFASLGGTLPLPTLILINVSHNMIWILPLLIVAAIAGLFWWRRNGHKDTVRAVVDPLRLKIPVFGMLMRKVAVARFTRNFATMTGAGVPILQSLDIVGQTSGNYVIEQALKRVQDSVRAGRSIAEPLVREPVFPSMVTQMIAVGEDSGSMETMLNKIADFYDDEVQATTEALTSLIEPIMIAVIGIIIGGMIVALYMPMFTIYSQIH
ncbi:MAG: type secretion system family protein [Microbacteriaceae bacterium]|nr:type secretion system family protein [Microbacteriaceae bacterium]